MNSRKGPAILALLGIAAAAALFFVLKDDEDAGTTVVRPTTGTQTGGKQDAKDGKAGKAAVSEISLRDGQPVGGVAEIEVAKGDRIAFTVKSDIDDEIHLHGYDVEKEVSAGRSVDFDVPATIDGVFEVESHHGAAAIAEVSVVP